MSIVRRTRHLALALSTLAALAAPVAAQGVSFSIGAGGLFGGVGLGVSVWGGSPVSVVTPAPAWGTGAYAFHGNDFWWDAGWIGGGCDVWVDPWSWGGGCGVAPIVAVPVAPRRVALRDRWGWGSRGWNRWARDPWVWNRWSWDPWWGWSPRARTAFVFVNDPFWPAWGSSWAYDPWAPALAVAPAWGRVDPWNRFGTVRLAGVYRGDRGGLVSGTGYKESAAGAGGIGRGSARPRSTVAGLSTSPRPAPARSAASAARSPTRSAAAGARTPSSRAGGSAAAGRSASPTARGGAPVARTPGRSSGVQTRAAPLGDARAAGSRSSARLRPSDAARTPGRSAPARVGTTRVVRDRAATASGPRERPSAARTGQAARTPGGVGGPSSRGRSPSARALPQRGTRSTAPAQRDRPSARAGTTARGTAPSGAVSRPGTRPATRTAPPSRGSAARGSRAVPSTRSAPGRATRSNPSARPQSRATPRARSAPARPSRPTTRSAPPSRGTARSAPPSRGGAARSAPPPRRGGGSARRGGGG